MEKNYNGYYELHFEETESCSENDWHYLKVKNNKIIDASFAQQFGDMDANEVEKQLKEVIGENFKDFVLDKVFYNEHNYAWYVREFEDNDFNYYEHAKERNRISLGLSEPEYQKKIADILQAKENKATLGKTGVMDKIAIMKSGHEGGK